MCRLGRRPRFAPLPLSKGARLVGAGRSDGTLCVLTLTLSSFFFSSQNSPAPHLLQLIFFWDTMNCNTHTHTGAIPCSLPLPLFASSSRSWSWSLGRSLLLFSKEAKPMVKEKKSCGFTGWFGTISAMEGRVSLVYLRNKLFQIKVQCLLWSRPIRRVLPASSCRSCSKYIHICLLRNAISWSRKFSFPFFGGEKTSTPRKEKKKLWVHGLVWDDLGDGGPSLPRPRLTRQRHV